MFYPAAVSMIVVAGLFIGMVKGQEVQAEINKLLDTNGSAQNSISQAENEIQRLIQNKGKL